MRKSYSTQRLEKIIKLLPLLTAEDILYLHKAIDDNISLRQKMFERIALHQKGTSHATDSPALPAQPSTTTIVPLAEDDSHHAA